MLEIAEKWRHMADHQEKHPLNVASRQRGKASCFIQTAGAK
jgi:hypothetical protein